MRVLCVGLVVCDLIIKPVKDHFLEFDTACIDTLDINVGGDAYNVAIGLRQLGVEADLFSNVGKDFWANLILDSVKSAGMKASLINEIDISTSRSAVMITEKGDRSFLSFKGACHKLSPSDVTDNLLAEYDVLFIGSIGDLPYFETNQLTDLLMRAKKLGLKTVLDLTGEINGEYMAIFDAAFPYLDVFLPSIREARGLSGREKLEDCFGVFHSKGIKTVCIKLGKDGSAVLNDSVIRHIDSFNVPCVDTTGAGDAFSAGFISGMIRGLNPFDCGLIGNYTGSRAVMQIGANAHLENLDSIVDYLNFKEVVI